MKEPDANPLPPRRKPCIRRMDNEISVGDPQVADGVLRVADGDSENADGDFIM